MFDPNPNSVAKFRATTAHSLSLSHVRKRCACNKIITAIQLQRYGMCAKCYTDRHRKP